MGAGRRSTTDASANNGSRPVDATKNLSSEDVPAPQEGGSLRKRSRGGRAGIRRGKRRLIFENLGQRRVLAVITGTVFQDDNGSLRQEPSEISLQSRLAYIDTNDNGQYDSDEAYALADENGRFRFEDVAEGVHPVRIFDGSQGQRQTFPTGAVEKQLPVSFSGAVDAVLAGGQLNILAAESLIRVETSGTRTSEFPLDFSPSGIVAAVSDHPLGNRSASIITGTFTEQGQGRSGVWLVQPGAERPRLVHYDSSADAFAESVTGVGDDGNGILIAGGENGGQIYSIHISRTNLDSPPTETMNVRVDATGDFVPTGTQVLASPSAVTFSPGSEPSLGSRSVVAWPGGDGGSAALVAGLWSNRAASWVEGSQTELVGATELLSFDDSAGLLAVRYADGGVGVLDVDASFASLQYFAGTSGPALLIPGEDAIATIVAGESNAQLVLKDVRSGETLADHPLNLNSIGTPQQLLPGDSLSSLMVIGEVGASAVLLNQPAAHEVQIEHPDQVATIGFGVQVEKENTKPVAPQHYSFTSPEDTEVVIDAATISSIVSDAENDRILSLVVQEPDNGHVRLNESGGFTYTPSENFYGTDRFSIQFHDGQSVSGPMQFSVSVTPQPDAPTGVQFIGEAIPEHTVGPYDVGSIVVLDPDVGEIHDLSVLDARFEVQDGRLILVGGGLNFEFEPTIELSISGYDNEAGVYFSQDILVHVADENDPITNLMADVTSIYENRDGVYVAQLSAMDEDENQLISFSVNDSRFETVNDEVWLKDGEFIDYESEQSVLLTVTASDQHGSAVSKEVEVPILDEPEAVSYITLSNETVMELEPGAEVGEVQLDGVLAANSFQLSVDDSRFEIDGATLKLIDDQVVRRSAAEQIELTITAQDVSSTFDAVSETFVIEVLENTSPFHNDENPYDVDGNGDVTPLDALVILNYLNVYGPGPVGPGDPGYGYDVNGDGQVTALDALLVINFLNLLGNGGTVGGEGSHSSDGEGEQEQVPAGSGGVTVPPLTSSDEDSPSQGASDGEPQDPGIADDEDATDNSGYTADDEAYEQETSGSGATAVGIDLISELETDGQATSLERAIDETVEVLSRSRKPNQLG